MTKLKCIIVEDEPLAMEVLKDYIGEVPFLELVGEYRDAIYAMEALPNIQVDVIFLDIHLPKLKGLDFLRILKSSHQVILTTAYHEYAIEGFNLNVTDYLLKPIEFERFLKAANKLIRKKEKALQFAQPYQTKEFRFFRIDRTNVKIYLQDILYIESLKDYVRIHTDDHSYVMKGQIGSFVKEFENLPLLRIHRSFAVARDHIRSYSSTEVEVGKVKLPIGRSYKELVASFLKN